jgi:TPR repeat protein/membrane protease YdiL (CAAX protease family)
MMRGFIPFLFILLCFVTPSVLADVELLNNGHIGIDVGVHNNSKFPVVDYVAAGGPAGIEGFQKGDELVAIDGSTTQGMPVVTARKTILGPIGSVVRLSILRQGSAEREIPVVRRSTIDAYMPAALAGDPRAQYVVGAFYYRGPAATRSLGKALDWFRKAADQGYARAEAELGYLYASGVGVPKDPQAGVSWDLKAAKQGLAVAERGLALCYLDGFGIGQSYKEAFAWFYSAAQQDDPPAEQNLAALYLYGNGVARNERDAFNWYYRAAQNNDSLAESELAYLYLWGIGVAPSEKDALGWYYRAAQQDNPSAEENLAWLYLRGFGVSQSDKKAFNWYYRSARNNDPGGEAGLAYMYGAGRGVARSDKDAFDWYYSAAEQNDSGAQANLGRIYLHGLGVPQNDTEAFKWYYRSARNNDGDGAWGLAYMYSKGRGVKKDTREALKWYQAAEHCFPSDSILKKDSARARLDDFFENSDSDAIETSLIVPALQPWIFPAFWILAVIYLGGCALLYRFSLGAPDVRPKLFLALGWVAFYAESQVVAFCAILLFGKWLTIGLLLFVSAILGPLPVIASTCGPNRTRVWKRSQVSWRTLLLYCAGACVGIAVMFAGYQELYAVLTHSPLPVQPTYEILHKAKHTSPCVAYACIGMIMPAAEELIFRYYIFDALRRRFSGKVTVILTAFLFSLVHLQRLYFVPLFVTGLLFGWVRLKTDSLRLPIFLHAMNNCLSLAFSS